MRIAPAAERRLRELLARPLAAHGGVATGEIRVGDWPRFRVDGEGWAVRQHDSELLRPEVERILRGTARTSASGLRWPFRSPVEVFRLGVRHGSAAIANLGDGSIELGPLATNALVDTAAGQALLRGGARFFPKEQAMYRNKVGLVSRVLRHERMHFENEATSWNNALEEGITELQAADHATARRFARKTGLPYLPQAEEPWLHPSYREQADWARSEVTAPNVPLVGTAILRSRLRTATPWV